MIQEESEEPSVAYQRGWINGRHGGGGFFTENPRLAEWEGAADRLACFLGHREGREARGRADVSLRRSSVPNRGYMYFQTSENSPSPHSGA